MLTVVIYVTRWGRGCVGVQVRVATVLGYQTAIPDPNERTMRSSKAATFATVHDPKRGGDAPISAAIDIKEQY